MTGFATKTISLTTSEGSSTVNLMLKTLNARYFEVQCKMPSALAPLETELIKFFKSKLHRGTVIFSAYVTNPNIFKGAVQPDLHIAQSYCDAAEQIKKKTQVAGTFSISDLIRQDNVFITEEKTIEDATKTAILAAIKVLTENVCAVRAEEGQALYDDLQQRCNNITQSIHAIEKRAQEVLLERKEKINAKLSGLEAQKEVTEQLLETQRSALYYELDKIDIHEEIVRFKSHIQALQQQLNSKEVEKGRRLDFTLQELGREINTIAAKCSDAQMSSFAIDTKVELEKAREQVQNVV